MSISVVVVTSRGTASWVGRGSRVLGITVPSTDPTVDETPLLGQSVKDTGTPVVVTVRLRLGL